MPIVAITPCRKPLDYEAAVRRAGATPRPLTRRRRARPTRSAASTGCCSRAATTSTRRCTVKSPHPTFDVAEPGRDAFEIDLIRRALDADLPVLAICRGLQVLNVALGGTLIQDIPSEPSPLLPHDAEGPATTLAHTVTVAPGSCLAALVGPDGVRAVNSRHHQAVRAPGRGLVVTAVAPDGIIEAAEVPAARFCVGVQWHPENFHRTGEFDRLFEGFVEACRSPVQDRWVRWVR